LQPFRHGSRYGGLVFVTSSRSLIPLSALSSVYPATFPPSPFLILTGPCNPRPAFRSALMLKPCAEPT
ncbi:hypothetical protein QBC32DRAFT_220331, partial [Pseudoneurospora amorphoporcata]